MIGRKISHYSVTAKLGEGGMGEVYRARDSRLNRDVALKVLPAAVAADPERMARFEREAQLLAALNHPNIAAIYGLEESDGVRCLVLELVEGPTLSERLAQGPVPLAEALPIARQVAEAVEAAHEKGIVHRDLKPGNIKVTPEGAVKVLDFGLAKAFAGDAAETDISKSPTLTVAATQAGVILGTAAYMSPEQAKGKAVDRRADIWAWGIVLFEMLSGKPAFHGETVSETLAAVMMREVDWSLLPPDVPAPIVKLLHRCLEKDVRRRLQAIGEARLALEDYLANPAAASMVAAAPPSPAALRTAPLRRVLPWAVAGVLLLALGAVTVANWWRTPAPKRAMRVSLLAPGGTTFDTFDFALSPDGTQVAFVAAGNEARPQLWVRRLDSLSAQPLAGTEGAGEPFWSPDSRSIGFFSSGKLRRVDAAGGAVQALADVSQPRGGSWSPDGVILYTPSTTSPVYRVPAAGGETTPATRLTQADSSSTNRWPFFLPDGRHFIFLSRGGTDVNKFGISLGALNSTETKFLTATEQRAVVASGHLLFMRDGNLMAQRFDTRSLELTGEPTPVAEQVAVDARYNTACSVSQDGKLMFLTGGGSDQVLTWFDRTGKRLGALGPDGFWVARLSPDGRRVAASVKTKTVANLDIWVYDLVRGTSSRLTFDPANDDDPVWSPDGQTLIFDSDRTGSYNIYRKAANGLGQEEVILEDKAAKYATSWSHDGRYLAFDRGEPGSKTGDDVYILPLFGDGKPFPLVQSTFDDSEGVFSPDDKWVAYQSNESGRLEIYIVGFPKPTARFQASTDGGSVPQWSPDGKELYYLDEDSHVMAVDVRATGESLQLGTPRELFSVQTTIGAYALVGSPDGKRIMVRQRTGENATALTLVVNWPTALPKP